LKSPSREKLNNTLRAMLAYATEQKIRGPVIVDVDALLADVEQPLER